MKKKWIALIAAACALCAPLAFAGCAEDERPAEPSSAVEHGYSICYAFTASGDVTEIGGQTSVKDYMDALQAAGKLAFTGSDGDYGFYIETVLGVGTETVGSTDHSWSGYSWMVYTTLTTLDDVPYSYSDNAFEYNGVALYEAAYGVSYLPCVEGQTYAFVYRYVDTTW